jgi:cysteine desulfurase
VIDLPANRTGTIEAGAALEQIGRVSHAAGRKLFAVQLANNETGVIQPVADIAARAALSATPVHCDAVQAAGRMAIDFAALGVATMSLSAHKIGGPKGVGALVVRDGTTVAPLLRGGGQERRRRGGTEAVALIAGFGAAALAAKAELDDMPRVAAHRDRLEQELLGIRPDAVVIGRNAERLPNTTCVAFPGRRAEALVIALDLAGVAVGAGSACSSGKMTSSHVLAAMGISPEIAGGAIRISIGAATTAADIGACLDALQRILKPAAAA